MLVVCCKCVQVCSLKRSEALESEVDLPTSSWLNPGEVSVCYIIDCGPTWWGGSEGIAYVYTVWGGNVCKLPAELNCHVFTSVNVYFIIYIINSMCFSTR